MLQSLHIRNYVLISSLDISFPKGLIVITGPTGAGKSILMGALGLLLGRKADASVLSAGATNCVVEGEFCAPSAAMEQFAAEHDFEYEEGSFTVRRTVSAAGRSRAFINDSPVTMAVLEEFGSMMVDIHSQHDTRLLNSSAYQLSILDAFAGNSALLGRCSEAYASMKELQSRISALESSLAAAEAEADYNKAVFEQLDNARIQEGEIEALEQEQAMLANAELIASLSSESLSLLEGSDDSDGVNNALSRIHKDFDKLSAYIPEFSNLASRLDSVRIELDDISSDLQSRSDSIQASPERLEEVDARLSLLYSLLKRHGVADEAALIAKRESLRGLVFGSEDMLAELEELKSAYAKAVAAYNEVSSELHDSRKEASARFCSRIKENLSFMEMERAAFEISLEESPASATGCDRVNFMFNAAGGRTVLLSKCASGGELSRIMLALKQLMGEFMSMPVMVFDEIDTGVSGSVADKMGAVICQMGQNMQVFAITHLPQVAAKGKAHYLVQKSYGEGQASSTIKKLSDEQRVLEIARMLSGSSLTDAAIENARSLMDF